MELIDQENAGMKKEMSKIPTIELSLTEITKNLELMQLQLNRAEFWGRNPKCFRQESRKGWN
ncbi:transposon Tf2-1 polyprotein isoform X1 [Cucumis melo var. makuwa]|uniref:Transposon Tf2-1 polyprotein isoform X1 n=1 Tax=Cucumis melo var. makuwa TaxID=1194695 RepID=A0A5A7TI66_CUCMM|nr:transposon Tf2-1 polyprotein isoform X1 [Cucumis melo var. makuwa]